ncbi:MAG: hypothetical protein DRO88_12875 [Promethearchaeia archaeon]|nr:MAG: hypothetical protein DRO88_12875 [Candidatus Lokiarchaeia archaeon]
MSVTLLPKKETEKKVLYSLIKYPDLSDKEISEILGIKTSTFTSIKKRLKKEGYYKLLIVPNLQYLGCEFVGVIFTSFNPVISLDARLKITKENIEISDEIFLSIGDPEKGFSLSLNENYTNFTRINERRTEIFGKEGLLEKEYPNEIIFPFKTSKTIEFFNYSKSLNSIFNLKFTKSDNYTKKTSPIKKKDESLPEDEFAKLKPNEKKILLCLVKYPEATLQEIADKINLTRHTVSRIKNRFFRMKLLSYLILPNLKKIGFGLLVFYHFKFKPQKPPTREELNQLNSDSTIYFVHKKFEAVMISIYTDYDAYKIDKTNKFAFLKKNELIIFDPIIRRYTFDRLRIIKDMVFEPITEKILENN